MFTLGRPDGAGAPTAQVDLPTGPVRLTGLAPDGTSVPTPGSTLTLGELRVLALPGRHGGTAALVLGLRGRTALWAPASPGGGDRLGAGALEALAGAELDCAVLDPTGPGGSLGLAGDLAALREVGAVSGGCDVAAVGLDATRPPVNALAVRFRQWGVRPIWAGARMAAVDSGGSEHQDTGRAGPVRPAPPRRCLVLGPAASGKSALAEDLLAAEPRVVYLAMGAAPDEAADPDWAARVRRHRDRRPATWRTQETTDARLLAGPGAPVLLDSLGGWAAATLERCGAWDDDAGWRERWEAEVAGLVEAWRGAGRRVVAVAEETGWGVVPQTASGRLFRDRLGEVNRRLAEYSEQCLLVIAGRVLDLDAAGQPW